MIGIIGFNDLHIMQYLKKYTNFFDEHGIEYEVVYWNRSLIEDRPDFNGAFIRYDRFLNTYQPFHKKIVGFLRYTAFMRKTIAKRKYDKLIILTTQTAIPLFSLLISKYRGRFIYDYRDITAEKKYSFYRRMVQSLISASNYTMISSKGFLPEIGVSDKPNILMSHNTQRKCQKSEYSVKQKSSSTIHIVYWGMVRQLDFNKKICDAFGNDTRFELTFHGDGYFEELKGYCLEKGYSNIDFTGRYMQKDIPSFIEKTDILNCIYENDAGTQPTVAVKAYDAIHYRLPVLISKASYLEKFMTGISGCCAVDTDELSSAADSVYEWYRELDTESAERDFEHIEKKIFNDDATFEEKLLSFSRG